MTTSRNKQIEIITLPAGTTDIDEYLAVGYDGELPSVDGAAIAGVLSKTAYAGKAKSVISRGESYIVVGEAGVLEGAPLWADTDGKFQHTLAAEIISAIALEDGDVDDVIRAIIIPHGSE